MYTNLLTVKSLPKLSKEDLEKDMSEAQVSILRSIAEKIAWIEACKNPMGTLS